MKVTSNNADVDDDLDELEEDPLALAIQTKWVWWSTDTNSDNVICQVGGSSRQLEWNYALRLEIAELDRYLHIIFSQEKLSWFITNFVYVVCWSAK